MNNTFINWLTILCLAAVTFVEASTKKGVCGWGSNFLCDDFKHLDNVAWMYDWRGDLNEVYGKHMRETNCPESTYMQYLPEYVPMIHNNASVDRYTHQHTNMSSNAKYLLGFNEPNKVHHANMSPREAADRWPEIERYSPGIQLVSPAPAGHDFSWLDAFFQLCKGCRVDYVAAHSYKCHANSTMSFLHSLYQRHGKKVWLTEFACPHSRDRHQQLRFMKDILPKLEAADYVFRYSWFSARIKAPKGDAPDGVGFMNPEASLFWPNSNVSSLTPLGYFYNHFQGHGHAPQVIG